MKGGHVSTRRRLEYARGYVALGLLKEAEKELEAIAADDPLALEAVKVRIDLHMEGKRWKQVVLMAGAVCLAEPAQESAWIAWAFALRELQRIEEARDVLLKAEPLHGESSSLLHYNLACYYSLLGDLPEARQRLQRAARKRKEWLEDAREDTDLKALWPELKGDS